jgi:hypothetical protein
MPTPELTELLQILKNNLSKKIDIPSGLRAAFYWPTISPFLPSQIIFPEKFPELPIIRQAPLNHDNLPKQSLGTRVKMPFSTS